MWCALETGTAHMRTSQTRTWAERHRETGQDCRRFVGEAPELRVCGVCVCVYACACGVCVVYVCMRVCAVCVCVCGVRVYAWCACVCACVCDVCV